MQEKITKPELRKLANDKALLERIRKDADLLLNHPLASESVRLTSLVLLLDYQGDDSRQSIRTQLSRSLNSIGANIIEGYGRGSRAQITNYFRIARGSAYESIIHARILGLDIVPEIISLAKEIDSCFISHLEQRGTTEDDVE